MVAPESRPGEDFSSRSTDKLPDVRGPRRPAGYRLGLQIEERLLGVLLVLIALGGMFVLYAIQNGVAGLGIPRPATVAPTLRLLMPFLALGSVGLLVVGVKQILAP